MRGEELRWPGKGGLRVLIRSWKSMQVYRTLEKKVFTIAWFDISCVDVYLLRNFVEDRKHFNAVALKEQKTRLTLKKPDQIFNAFIDHFS